MGKRGPKPTKPKHPLAARHLYIRQLAEIVGYVDASGNDSEEYEKLFKKLDELIGAHYRKDFAGRWSSEVSPITLLTAVRLVLLLIRPRELADAAALSPKDEATVRADAVKGLRNLLPNFDPEWVSPKAARSYAGRSKGKRPQVIAAKDDPI